VLNVSGGYERFSPPQIKVKTKIYTGLTMQTIRTLLIGGILSCITVQALAWTAVTTGPWVSGNHRFYYADNERSPRGAQATSDSICFDDNRRADLYEACQFVAKFDGPAAIIIVSGDNHSYAIDADSSTRRAVAKTMAACVKLRVDDCHVIVAIWDGGEYHEDAPPEFRAFYKKLHGGRYWARPVYDW
jgi:hypothetical protein